MCVIIPAKIGINLEIKYLISPWKGHMAYYGLDL